MVEASFPTPPGLRLVRSERARCARSSSSATSSRRRTAPPPTPRSPRRSAGQPATTGRPRRRSSWPKAVTCSRRRHRSRGRTEATRGSGRSPPVPRGSGRSTSSSRRAERARAELAHAVELVRGRSPAGGASSGRARRERRRKAAPARRWRGRQPCCSRSPCSPRAACGGISRMRAAASPGTALGDGSSGSSPGSRALCWRSSGVLAGWVVGSAVGALAARLAGAPPVEVLRHSVASRGGLALALGAALVAAALIALDHLAASARGRSDRRHRPRGRRARCSSSRSRSSEVPPTRIGSRRGQGLALVLLLVPGLVALAAAVLVDAVSSRRVARMVARRSWGSVSARLAAVGLARGPGRGRRHRGLPHDRVRARAGRGGISRNARPRRAGAGGVPGPARHAVVREDLGKLVRVFDAASPARFRRARRGGGAVHPVLRVTGGAGRAEQVSGVTVLGLDRAPIERLGVWRAELGGRSKRCGGRLARGAVGTRRRCAPSRLPGDEIALRVGPGIVSFAAVVETRRRRVRARRARCGRSARSPPTLRAAVPQRVAARLARRRPASAAHRGRRGRRDGAGPAPWAQRPACAPASRMGGAGRGRDEAGADGVELRYVLTPRRTAYLRFRAADGRAPPSVLVTPRLAELVGGVGGLAAAADRRRGGAGPDRRRRRSSSRARTARPSSATERRSRRRSTRRLPEAARENEVWLEAAAGTALGARRRPWPARRSALSRR